MRVLGLDYGERRIGVAISDELGMTAQGLPTIERKNREADLERIGEVVRRYAVERIVVGFPLRQDGSEGIQCEKVNRFIRQLVRRIPLPVIRRDELFSTQEAEERLREGGIRGRKRRSKVDRLAACIILQRYLDDPSPVSERGDATAEDR